jgi:hypothetical protein
MTMPPESLPKQHGHGKVGNRVVIVIAGLWAIEVKEKSRRRGKIDFGLQSERITV